MEFPGPLLNRRGGVDLLDVAGLEAVVKLDGRGPDYVAANLDRYDAAMPGLPAVNMMMRLS